MKKPYKNKLPIYFAIIVLSLFSFFAIYMIYTVLENPSKITATDNNENNNIKTDKKMFGDIEITIPASLVNDSAEPTVTAEAKELGVKKIEKQNDGSFKYTFERSKYKKYLNYLREETKNTMDSIASDAAYKSISKIDYNNNFSNITISVNKEAYENSFESIAVTACGISGMLYQAFDTSAPHTVTINVKDISTEEIFNTVKYPDALNN